MSVDYLADNSRGLARSYSPPGALICSGLYLSLAVVSRGPWQLLVAGVLAVVGQVAYLRRKDPAVFLAKVSLPLLLPLLAIHGILNPQFPRDYFLWSCIPLRGAGAAFATVIACRLLLVAAAMSVWRYTVGSQVIGYFHRLGLPSSLIAGFAVATSSVEVLQQRGHAVYLAQQARGINLRASFAARIAGLPKLVIPVAVATIVESGERGIMMESRGLGSGSWRLHGWYSPPSERKIFMECISAAATLAAFAIR